LGYSRWDWRAPRTTPTNVFESMRDVRLGVPLSTGDTSKWNEPDVSGSGRVRAGWVAGVAWPVWLRTDETAGSPPTPGSLGVAQLPRRTLAPLPEHPDEHSSERPVLLAVDQAVCSSQAIAAKQPIIPAKTHQGRGFSQRVLAKIKNPEPRTTTGMGK
jgi:hypothetical protein